MASALQTSVLGILMSCQVAPILPAQINTTAATGRLHIARCATTFAGLTGSVSTQYSAETPQMILAMTASSRPWRNCCGEISNTFLSNSIPALGREYLSMIFLLSRPYLHRPRASTDKRRAMPHKRDHSLLSVLASPVLFRYVIRTNLLPCTPCLD